MEWIGFGRELDQCFADRIISYYDNLLYTVYYIQYEYIRLFSGECFFPVYYSILVYFSLLYSIVLKYFTRIVALASPPGQRKRRQTDS